MSGFDVGICGWCADRHDVARSITVAAELGFSIVQLGFFSRDSVEQADVTSLRSAFANSRMSLVGAFLAFEGEDYSSIGSIADTGGLADDAKFDDRSALFRRTAAIGRDLALPSVAMHIGTVPHTVPSDDTSRRFATLVERTRAIADIAADHGLKLLIETGREPAESLMHFLMRVNRPNVAVNYDPANFVIYGTDDPVRAVSQLKGHIDLVHLKDAFRSEKPGKTFGKPAPFGQGDAEIARVISKLRSTGYRGPLLLECDTRTAGLDALRSAADYIRSMFA